ncbi:MAG TPA: hypothetical protein EYP69_02830 [Bacteroidales bacterium]|nr:hypothetical protein [Bacteroidales bacterium]
MKKVTVILVVIIMVVVSACNSKSGKTQRLSGDYTCTEHWNSDLIGKAIMSFDRDSVNFAGIAKTTYRIKDDSVFIDMHQYEMGFAIDGNTLKATGGAGTVAYTKK